MPSYSTASWSGPPTYFYSSSPAPMMMSSYPPMQMARGSAFAPAPMQQQQGQPTLNFVPSGNFNQRLMAVPSGQTNPFAGRRMDFNNPNYR